MIDDNGCDLCGPGETPAAGGCDGGFDSARTMGPTANAKQPGYVTACSDCADAYGFSPDNDWEAC